MFEIIHKIFALLELKEKRQLFILFTLVFTMSFIEMIGIASIMPFMGVVSNPDIIRTNAELNKIYSLLAFDSTHDFLFSLGLLLLVLVILSNLLKALTIWLTLKYDNKLNYTLARRLLAQYLSRPYPFFLNRNTSEMGKNVLSEVKNVISGCFTAGIQVLSSGMVCLLILCLLVAIEPLVALILVIFFGATYAGIFLLVRRRLTLISKEQVHANSMRYKSANEALNGIKDIKILGRELFFLNRFAEHALRYSQNTVAAGTITMLPRYILEVMAFSSILLIVFYFMGETNASANLVVPLLAVYTFAGYRLLPALQQLFAGITSIRLNLANLDVLYKDIDGPLLPGGPELMLNKYQNLQPLHFCREIELRNVSFCYAEAKHPALRGIYLSIPRNTSVGLVGATGSGKTTAVDIVLGLLSPTSGQVLVDGIEISGESLPSWQRNFGYIPQQVFLCDDTITRNIAFGVPDHKVDMTAVTHAARIANLQDFIENKLPKGYETVIGERGVRLSGGQRQRIAIARALYCNPSLLVMDEATNALDGLTEEAVMEMLRTLSGKKTIITIAHRLTTVKDCDVIYIFQHGRITNIGTYDELRRSSSWFKAAVRHA